MVICVLRTNVVLIAIFVLVTLTLLALTIAFLQGAGGNFFHALGGYLGIVSSLLAWYLALAGILPYINPGLKLPVGPVS
jgi:succinate-acetate transporter protein